MRATTTKFYERHLEKFLIGAALVIFLVVIWLFFVQPYEATIGNQAVNSAALQVRIGQELEKLKQKNADTKPPLGAGFVLVDYAKKFSEDYAAPVTPSKQFVGGFGHGGLGNVTSETNRPTQVVLPPVPSVVKPLAASNYFTLAEGDPAVTAEMIKLVGADQPPRDFVATSVVGWFDLPKWYNALSNDPNLSDEGRRRAKLLVDVKLIRQTRDPVTGQWGAMDQGKWKADGWETVASTGEPNFRPLTAPQVSLNETEVQGLLDDPTDPKSLAASQSEIAERPFLPVSADRPWMPPDLSAANRGKFQSVVKELADVRQRMKAIKAGEAVPEAPGMPPPPGVPPRTTLQPNRPVPPRGAAPPPNPYPERERIFHPPDEGDDAPAINVPRGRLVPPRVADPLEPLRAREHQLLQDRNQLLGLPAAAPPVAGADDESPTQMVRLIAHDLTARPGATYRYAFIACLVNPLFHQFGFEQHPDFNRLAVASTQPGWSNEITTESLSRSFLAKISARDGTANFQIWRVFGGQWQSAEIKNVRVGEVVSGSVAFKAGGSAIVVHTGLVLVDVTDDPAADGRALLMRQDDGTVAESSVIRDQQDSRDFGARVAGGAGVASAVP